MIAMITPSASEYSGLIHGLAQSTIAALAITQRTIAGTPEEG